jgi:transcription antitermination factor NusG
MATQVAGGYHLSLQSGPVALTWYGVRTKSNFEKSVAVSLECKGLQPYLPQYIRRKEWSDRVVERPTPLFPGYVFCRFDSTKRVSILNTPGVVGIVGFGNQPAPIPDAEIEAVRHLLNSGLAVSPCCYLNEGDRVRIRSGTLEGLEGILVKKKSAWRLIVSVNMLQRSVMVEIDQNIIAAA